MGLLKKLASETAVYGASSIIGRFLNYLLVPLYTSVFAPEEYGIVTELYAYMAFLNVIYVYGLETTYFRFINKKGANESRIFNLATSSILLTTLLFTCLIIAFAGPISVAMDYPGRSNLIIWLASILAIDAILAIPFARLRQEGKAMRFATTKLINIGVNILLNLIFILWLPLLLDEGAHLTGFPAFVYNPEWGVEYVFISNLAANALLFVLLANTIAKFRPMLSWPSLKPLLFYAYPILFAGLAGVTNEMLSRALLKYWLPDNIYPGQSNLTALGIFGACYKLSVFMTLAVQAFRYAAEPFFFANAPRKDSPELFARLMNWFIIFGSFAFLVISTNLDILGLVFLRSEVYREGLHIVPYLLMGGLFLGIYYNLSIWYKLTDRTVYGALISSGGALLTIIFNLILIPQIGYLGSAITTALTYISMAVWSYWLGQRYYPVPYNISRSLLYIGAALLLVLAAGLLGNDMISVLVAKIGAPLFFGLLVYWNESS